MSTTSARRGGENERHYALVHRTAYTYAEPVTSSYGTAMLLPREIHGQRVHQATLVVTPTPAETAEHRDVSGNRSSYFHVTQEHTALEVVASSLVTVTRRRLDIQAVPQVPWERAVASVSAMRATGKGEQGEGPSSVLAIVESALPSAMIEPEHEVFEYALPSFGPGTPLVRVVADLSHRIRGDLPSRPGATTAPSRLADLLERRAGASQELAHLMVGCLRAMGLAARYVTGYVEAVPSPGRDGLRGADVSHAWASVWIPGGGWVHIDPTHDQFIDNRYVVLGWGRDVRDVSPLRGIVFTPGTGSSLSVEVDLTAVGPEEIRARRGEAVLR
ncbi:transglutaminase family protein [Georgenia sp. SYP-B2076]|uniref:transglutaminase family protein n=1 Tax=Georgenia sp. SYP-B2076 TaxID=2495881 RepID=UPI001F0C49FE|nr:transglutaminase family protein [Georgenia sp. SYP-B2076]